MILVVGATGQLGGTITRSLLGGGDPVRIVVRPGSPFEALRQAGAEPVLGDLKDPSSLRAACEGAEAVVTTANSALRGGEDTVDAVDLVGNRDLVDAAVSAGVRRFLFVSAAGADLSSPNPFMQAKARSEQHLRESGMTWTVLAPLPFMDLWIPAVVGGPVLTGQPVALIGAGRRRHSFVAVRDVASYAVAALTHPAAEDQTLVVGGPEPITWRDIVAEFERALDTTFSVTTVAPGDPVPGLPPVLCQLLAYLDTYDSPVDMSDLADTYGVKGTSLADFVLAFLQQARESGRPGVS